MITATISGRITKDATMRQAGNSNVCSFGMASNKTVKGEDKTTFVDVSIFGARGDALRQYLTKGSFVVVSGELSTREHAGKFYVQIDAQSVDLGPRSKGGDSAGAGNGGTRSAPKDEYGNGDEDDSSIPF